jgi:hypothetical protein
MHHEDASAVVEGMNMFCREVLVARERLPGARRLADDSLLAE